MRNLIEQFRPKSLADFIGQEHLLGENAPLKLILDSYAHHYTMKSCGQMPHIVIFGPAGSGKTSLARIIAQRDNQVFLEYNATNFKLESLKKELAQYRHSLIKPLLFVDEIHRLNIAQQEFFLPILEKNEICFIGASTENPFFVLSAPLRSRLLLFEFKALTRDNMEFLYQKVVAKYPPKHYFQHVKQWLLDRQDGDCRVFLRLLDIALDIDSKSIVELETLQEITKHSQGVRENSVHYDYISALIKSIRGSDENAAIYYLACLIQCGENPEFIARRLVILASEDIGNANPNAFTLSVNTMNAVSKIGYPEARIILAQCVIYLSCSPKSNSAYSAINMALQDVQKSIDKVPLHLCAHAQGYRYPHNFGGFVLQKYHQGKEYVQYKNIGFEKTLQEWLMKIKTEIRKNEK
ncbi:replication-associated recombination protein A [Helicobacter aurati]|uniref:Replication-associated recombination protein A n=1 Tax=Helicobacter aurati TaxID=137778 RepID=A0A3D8IZZ5_9HELI|nr:replication-associated recombination protein A [Helicobacter aurati]RDU70530.1 replication-associated recombination protein A [Helicobacter aurati]